MTCFNSDTHETFIVGRKYLTLEHFYYKEIARVQSQWYTQQSEANIKYPKSSKHIKKLYEKKNNAIKDYFHKITRHIVNYCISNDIHTVVIGDINGICKDNTKDDKFNQQLHALPYNKIYNMLEYKLALEGINFVKQTESYSSQTSPLADEVCKKNAVKSNRIYRGLYVDGTNIWNADCVGAYNILRLYLKNNATGLNPYGIKVPKVIKVAV
jgi:putative transposase